MKFKCLLLVAALGMAALPVGTAQAEEGLINLREVTVANGHRHVSRTVDVAIQPDGFARGRVVEADGTPLDGARVVVRQQDHVAATVVTDNRGEFAVEGLSHGVYQIETPTVSGSYRFWGSDSAPPSASPVALVVSQDPTLRGQLRYGNYDLLTLGLGAAGVTLGVIALDKAEDAETHVTRLEATSELRTPVSP